jgi:hypothetical protein
MWECQCDMETSEVQSQNPPTQQKDNDDQTEDVGWVALLRMLRNNIPVGHIVMITLS